VSLPRDDFGLCASGNWLHPERSVAAAIGDECDFCAVRRPARINVVESAVGNGESVATLGRYKPELVPLLAEVRAVDEALAIRRKVRPRLPGRLFVVDLVGFCAGFGLHAPEAASAVNVTTVRDENNLCSIGRPSRADLVIKLAVVIARQRTARFSGQALEIC